MICPSKHQILIFGLEAYLYFHFIWNSLKIIIYILKWLVCWAYTNGCAPPAPFGWHMQAHNKIESHLTGCLSMRLATLGIVARRVYWGGPWRSSGQDFFPSSLFALSPPRKLCCPLQKKKKKGQAWFQT